MMDFLYSVDVAVFHFINGTLAHPVGDMLWPLITDYARLLPVRIIFAATWLWLLIKGGSRGRTAALLVIPILLCSDQISSALIKQLVHRPRPCHLDGGVPVVQGIHLLVDCGAGKSFPSSHAVNNFAVATLFSFYYRKGMWAFIAWASLVALSRAAVGVHYPSDIVGGAMIGSLVGGCIIVAWTLVQRRYFPALSVEPGGGRKE